MSYDYRKETMLTVDVILIVVLLLLFLLVILVVSP